MLQSYIRTSEKVIKRWPQKLQIYNISGMTKALWRCYYLIHSRPSSPIQIIPFLEWLSHIEQLQHFVYIRRWQFAVIVHTDISCSPAIDAQLIFGKFSKLSYFRRSSFTMI